jgi:two-component system, NarL family, sensor kinase
MATNFIYNKSSIGICYILIFLAELMAPIEYVLGHLYVVPILLTACRLNNNGISTLKNISATLVLTRICVFLTLFDFVIPEIIAEHILVFHKLPIATLINRFNVVFILLLSHWLIKCSLEYMEEISCQKEKINQYKSELLTRIQLDRIHEDFVYTLTHDLKTPLLGAILTIKYFQKEKFGSVNSTQSKVLSIISRSQQRSLQLVETLVDVYRNDIESLILQYEPIDLRSIATEAIDAVVILGLERQITFNLKYDEPTDRQSELTGDRLQLSRVFSNLLSNAIYHSPRGGQIDVTIGDRDRQYVVGILDRGLGIALADLPFIFDRFYQAQNQWKGSGLGLHLSRQIVEAHGGEIWAESVLPQGAKFCFSLPIKNLKDAGSIKDIIG